MSSDDRRATAIKMLDEWAQAAYAADWWSQYVIQRGNKPVSPVTVEELNGVVQVLQDEANELREEILMLMGVDDTLGAYLETSDREKEELEKLHKLGKVEP